ncbi:rCG57658, partial [Rattus norvegicus]
MERTVNPDLSLWNFLPRSSVILMKIYVTSLEQIPACVRRNDVCYCHVPACLGWVF